MSYRQHTLKALLLTTSLAAIPAMAQEAFYKAKDETRGPMSLPPGTPARASKPSPPMGALAESGGEAKAAPAAAISAAPAMPSRDAATPLLEAAGGEASAPAQADAANAPEESLVRRRRQQGESAPAPVRLEAVAHDTEPRKMSEGVREASFVASDYRSDPVYPDHYDAEAQYVIYGGKRALSTPRPLLELGYPLYSGGTLGATHAFLGEKNLVRPQFLAYGDYRAAYGNNDNGGKAVQKSLLATRLNLDLDLKLTGTERLHVLMRPLDQDGKFTRVEFKGAPTSDGKDQQEELNAKPVTAFFEGDLGALAQGFTGSYNKVDLPIAFGLVPLLVQNGIWLDDAFTGAAITLPARNSRTLDISNFDITAFAGFDEVSTAALGKQANGQFALNAGRVYGLASFFERRTYYFEADYGYLDDRQKIGGFDHSYHNVSAAVTHRIHDLLSYSVRVIHNLGQKDAPGFAKTADGTMLLWESSFMTSKPYTLLPYLNLFYADGTPQALARDAGGGGVLKNTGLSFETDGLTGFPKLDDNGFNAQGGALGLQYLFNLDRQLVGEVAAIDRHGAASKLGTDYAFGLRYQQPISRQWIFRTDGIIGDRHVGKDFYGARVELRCKF